MGMATLEELTDRIRKAAAFNTGLSNSVKLDLKGEGFIHIDGAQVLNADKAADLVVTVSLRDLAALGKKQLDPALALMTGRLKLSDMGLAMKIQPQIQSLFEKAG